MVNSNNNHNSGTMPNHTFQLTRWEMKVEQLLDLIRQPKTLKILTIGVLLIVFICTLIEDPGFLYITPSEVLGFVIKMVGGSTVVYAVLKRLGWFGDASWPLFPASDVTRPEGVSTIFKHEAPRSSAWVLEPAEIKLPATPEPADIELPPTPDLPSAFGRRARRFEDASGIDEYEHFQNHSFGEAGRKKDLEEAANRASYFTLDRYKDACADATTAIIDSYL